MRENFDEEWEGRAKDLLKEIKEWRLSHPKATLGEIEAETDRRLDRLRSRVVSDAASASDAADWKEASEPETPTCAKCREPLTPRGARERRLRSQGGDDIVLKRDYGVCPACGAGLFPPG